MSENERSHVEGRPHLWRLFGVVLCRFCEEASRQSTGRHGGWIVSGLVMDFPAAWEYVRTTDPTDHHDQCSWRSTGGALLCDCTVLNDEYKRREARAKALDEVRAAVENINDRDLDTLTIALVLAEIDKLKEVPTDER